MTRIKLSNADNSQSVGVKQAEEVQGVAVTQTGGAQSFGITQAAEAQVVGATQVADTQPLSLMQADEQQGFRVAPDASFLKGESGATFTPHVDEEGNLSWTNDGGLDNPDPVNIKGPKGDGDGSLSAETDPTVPAWAKAAMKPSYTASEVGADERGSAANALSKSKSYTDKQIAAIPTPDVSGQINAHNVSTDAHNDIRLFLQDMTARVNALADSDDDTLDQMSEIVAYIKANRELVEQVTNVKVSVSDIIDNLITNVPDRPLSAAQGVVLKALVDAIEIPTVPTKVSAFENDKGYLTELPEHEHSQYLTEHQSLAEYAKKSELPEVPTKVSAFDNDAGYLTEIDKGEIIDAVLAAIPNASGVSF